MLNALPNTDTIREDLAPWLFGDTDGDTQTSEPVITHTDSTQTTGAEVETWLRDPLKSDIHSSRIDLVCGGLVTSSVGFARPTVASPTLCAVPSSNGGSATYSPHSLIGDRWKTFRRIANGSLTLSSGSPTGNLSIASNALDRDLPAGFCLRVTASDGVTDRGWVRITSNVSAGSTTLPLHWINNNCSKGASFTVAIVSTDILVSNSFWYPQHNVSLWQIRHMNLTGDPPVSRIDSDPKHTESARYYACDGIACSGVGYIEGLRIEGFPGWAAHLESRGNTDTQSGQKSPYDVEAPYVGQCVAERCLSGFYLGWTDGSTGSLKSGGMKDFAFYVTAGPISGGHWHGWGSNVAIYTKDGSSIKNVGLEAADSNGGLDMFGDYHVVTSCRVYNNLYYGARYWGTVDVSGLDVTHASNAVDGGDGLPTGYAVILGSWGDATTLKGFRISCSGGAHGLLLGHTGGKTLGVRSGSNVDGVTLQGNLHGDGTTGSKGLVINSPIVGLDGTVNITGFNKHFTVTSTGSLTGSRLIVRGPSSGVVTWANAATGTFAAPNYQSGIASDQVQFIPL